MLSVTIVCASLMIIIIWCGTVQSAYRLLPYFCTLCWYQNLPANEDTCTALNCHLMGKPGWTNWLMGLMGDMWQSFVWPALCRWDCLTSESGCDWLTGAGEKEVAVRQRVSPVPWDPASDEARHRQPRAVSSWQRRRVPGVPFYLCHVAALMLMLLALLNYLLQFNDHFAGERTLTYRDCAGITVENSSIFSLIQVC